MYEYSLGISFWKWNAIQILRVIVPNFSLENGNYLCQCNRQTCHLIFELDFITYLKVLSIFLFLSYLFLFFVHLGGIFFVLLLFCRSFFKSIKGISSIYVADPL